MSSRILRQGQSRLDDSRHPGSIWIDQHRGELLSKNKKWVAANTFGLVASDASIEGLMIKIRDQNIDPSEVAIAFITRDSA